MEKAGLTKSTQGLSKMPQMKRKLLMLMVGAGVAGFGLPVPNVLGSAHADSGLKWTYCYLDDFTTSPKTTYYSDIFPFPEDEPISAVEGAFEEYIEDAYRARATSVSCEYSLSGRDSASVRRTRNSRIDTEKVLHTHVVVTAWQYH